VKRGVFFADGEEWTRLRQPLNRIMLKKGQGVQMAQKAAILSANQTVEALKAEAGEENHLPIGDLVSTLHAWSIDATVRALLGPGATARVENQEKLVSSVSNFFRATVDLQFLSSDEEAKRDSPLWREFERSMDDTLKEALAIFRGEKDERGLSGLLASR